MPTYPSFAGPVTYDFNYTEKTVHIHDAKVSILLICVIFCRQKGAKACCWKVLALACFPFTSVAVAWFSWPHLIGTEMFYIMAGIGYKHSYFKKYKLITQKAELSGDPNCSRFPDSYQDMTEVHDILQYH